MGCFCTKSKACFWYSLDLHAHHCTTVCPYYFEQNFLILSKNVRFNTFIQVFNFGFVSAGESIYLTPKNLLSHTLKNYCQQCSFNNSDEKETTYLFVTISFKSLLSFQSANENDQPATNQFNQGISHLFMSTPINLFSYGINQICRW